MARRLAGIRIAALAAALVGLLGFTAPTLASDQDAGLVLAALHVLQQEYLKPVQPVALLNSAIDSLDKSAHIDAPHIADGTPAAQAEGAFRRDFAAAARSGAVQQDALAYQVTREMVGALHDTHTFYLDPAQYAEWQRRYAGQPGYAGIGTIAAAVNDVHGHPVLVYAAAVFPGSPAEVAGVQQFDQYIQVNGAPVNPDATPVDVTTLLRGPVGTAISLTVRRKGHNLTLALTRRAIQIPAVTSTMMGPGVAYVRLLQFTKGASDEFRRELRALQAQGPLRGIVLDLRENAGGLFSELDPIAGTVLPTGTLLAREFNRQGEGQLVATGTPLAPQTPLVVLTNSDTFSSGEVLSLALHDARRATLIGEKTGGALGATITTALPAGAIGVTVAEVDGPQYEQVDRVGVAPDRVVPLTVEDVSSATDSQLDAALKALADGN